LDPRAEVHVTATKDGASFSIKIEKGAGLRASDGGVVAFKLDDAGQPVAVGPPR
jgi:hypothetical protein